MLNKKETQKIPKFAARKRGQIFVLQLQQLADKLELAAEQKRHVRLWREQSSNIVTRRRRRRQCRHTNTGQFEKILLPAQRTVAHHESVPFVS